jgi:biotin carboxyl carrier protein
MSSTVVKIIVENDQLVKQGQVLLVLEAMKMETDILSDKDGTVKEIKIKPGDTVTAGELLLVVE